MASSASSDAADLRRRGRQRLIGAVAIVLLLVVFVPMLLDSEPRRAREEPAVDIPNKDTAPPLPMPAKSPSPSGEAAKSPSPLGEGRLEGLAKGLANADSATPADAGTATPQAAQPAAVATVAPKSPSPKGEGTKPKLEGFAVQVGAFRDEGKLRQAREKLAAASIPHYTERLGTSSGELTRLRAGPFPTRQAADAAAAKLKEGGLPSQVVPLP